MDLLPAFVTLIAQLEPFVSLGCAVAGVTAVASYRQPYSLPDTVVEDVTECLEAIAMLGDDQAGQLLKQLRAGHLRAIRVAAKIGRWRSGDDTTALMWRDLAQRLGEEPLYSSGPPNSRPQAAA